MTKNTSDRLAKLSTAANSLTIDTAEQLKALKGLTEQQQLIARFKLRGLSQKALANLLDVTPARISQEVKAIRQHFQARGSYVDQAVTVGETSTLYEEVERRAWEVYHDPNDSSKRLRALETVMSARERHIKLLMDLGLMKRAAIEHQHGVAVSPVMEALTPERREEIVARIIEPTAGAEPTPPEDDFEDEFIEHD